MQAPKIEVEEIIVFSVPWLTPPSVNHAYLPVIYTGKDGAAHRGRKLSKDARAFKEATAIFSHGRTVVPRDERERKKARYRVTIDITLGHRARLDADNANKIAIDSLAYAGVIDTDAKVVSCTANIIRDDRENPGTCFHVERLEN